jgi:hypothetical protein
MAKDLGALENADEQRRRWTSSSDGQVEGTMENSQPTCNYTRGFLYSEVGQVVGGTRVDGVEAARQSMDDGMCRVVVQGVGE